MKMNFIILVIIIFLSTYALSQEIQTKNQPPLKQYEHDSLTANFGFMYWYGPNILDIYWKLTLTGTVTNIQVIEEDSTSLSGRYTYRGTVKIERILYRSPTKDRSEFKFNYFSSAGFINLKVGDKILVFFTEYEGDYAIPNFYGGNCNLGYKLKSWDDEIIMAVEKFIELDFDIVELVDNQVLSTVWSKYNSEGMKIVREKVPFYRKAKKKAR